MPKNLYRLKIAKVVSDYHVILNAGARDDVAVGMEFVIFSLGEQVTDPDTGEDLGQIELVKGTVEVDHVQDGMARAVSNRFSSGNAISPKVRLKLSDPEVGDSAKRIA